MVTRFYLRPFTLTLSASMVVFSFILLSSNHTGIDAPEWALRPEIAWLLYFSPLLLIVAVATSLLDTLQYPRCLGIGGMIGALAALVASTHTYGSGTESTLLAFSYYLANATIGAMLIALSVPLGILLFFFLSWIHFQFKPKSRRFI